MWILIACFFPSAAAGTAIDVEFASGASVAGPLSQWNATWVVLVFDPNQTATVSADLPEGFNSREQVHFQVGAKAYVSPRLGPPLPWTEGVSSDEPQEFRWWPRDGWSALFVEADQIQLDLIDGHVVLLGAGNGCATPWLRESHNARRLLPPDTCAAGAEPVVVARQLDANDGGLGVAIQGQGRLRMVIHNFDNACGGEACPGGGSRTVETVETPTTSYARLRAYEYVEVTGAAADVIMSAEPTAIVFGGGVMDAMIDGQVRLPQASGALCAETPGCVVDPDQTLRAWGNLSFVGVGVGSLETGRLGAALGGDIQQLAVDEAFVTASAPQVVVAAVGIAAALALAAKFAIGLLTTRQAQSPLAHPNRRKLYDYILANPGGTFRELVRATGIPTGTARHHLGVLRQASLIQQHGHKATLRYFENHGRFDDSWNTVVMLREGELATLHAWLVEHPGSKQREVLDAAASQWGWSRSTTQHRLGRLATEGLVGIKSQGRMKLYTAAKRAPLPLRGQGSP